MLYHVVFDSQSDSFTKRFHIALHAQDIKNFISWEIVASEEAIAVTSAVHTIRLRRITASSHTFVEWFTDFSSDATFEVIEDSKFKKLDAFKDLAEASK